MVTSWRFKSSHPHQFFANGKRVSSEARFSFVYFWNHHWAEAYNKSRYVLDAGKAPGVSNLKQIQGKPLQGGSK
jgi:hypothetical protein